MKLKNILSLIGVIWIVFVIIFYFYSLGAIAYDCNLVLTIIALGLPSWILFLIALKLHMKKKSLFSWGKF